MYYALIFCCFFSPLSDHRYTTTVIDVFNGTAWSVPPITLSFGRESLGAAATPNGDIIFAGGWATGGTKPVASDVVDVFSTTGSHGGGGATPLGTTKLKTPSYWPGAVSVNGSAYVVSNQNLHVIRGADVVATLPLPVELQGQPSSLDGGGGIPSAHVPGNGVAVGGRFACYYSIAPNALYCYDTATLLWHHAPATERHQGGAMAVVGKTVMIAGGYTGDFLLSKPTAVVDIFDVSYLSAADD